MAQGLERIPLVVGSDFKHQPVPANLPDQTPPEMKFIGFEPNTPPEPEAQPQPASRSFGDVVGDTVSGLGKGAGSLVKGIGWLANSDTLQELGSQAEDYWGEKQSAELHRQLENVGKAEGVVGTVQSLLHNPAAIGDYIATSIPQMVPGLGVGSAGARSIVAFAGNTARNAALKSGASEAVAMQVGRAAAEKAAEKAATRFAVGANMLGEGAVSGGSTGAEVEEFLKKKGIPEEQAKAEANKAALMAGAWTTAGAGIGAGMETRAMLGQLKDTGIKGLAKNVGKEALEEAIQNPGEDYAAYQAKVKVDPEQKFDPGKSATIGAVTGGIMGGGFHVAGRVGERKDSAAPSADDGSGASGFAPSAQPPGDGGGNASGAISPVPQLSAPTAIEGDVLGPEVLPGGQRLLESPPIEGEIVQDPKELPRVALPAPRDGGPTDRQQLTARALLNNHSNPSPELLTRTMHVDPVMANLIYQHWLQNEGNPQGETDGGITANETHASVAAQGAEGGSGHVSGGGGLLAPELAGSKQLPGNSSEMAASGVRSSAPDGVASEASVAPTDLDVLAHGAATSPFNAHAQPTEAQKASGNYRKGHVTVQGLPIAIENPAGSTRSGKDASGNAWQTEMQNHYGYIKGTVGRDKDHLDVFLGPQAEDAGTAYVIDQIDPKTGRFDEHKIILGATSEQEARAIYQANYQAGWNGLGAITAMPMADFKTWIKSGNTKKPIGIQSEQVQSSGKAGNESWAISPYRYAKDKVSFRVTDGSGYKGRLSRLAEQVGGRYVSRAGGYVMSEKQARKALDLYEKGFDASVFTGKLEAPNEVERAVATPEEHSDVQSKEGKIEDFGEKIGGARKDLWTSFKDKLNEISDEEIITQPLSKIWPEPDYQKMLDGGADSWAVSFIHAARDEIPRKPGIAWKQKRWAEQVKTLREMASDVISGKKSAEFVRNEFEKVNGLKKLGSRIELYQLVGHGQSLSGVSFEEHYYSLYKGRENVHLWVVEQDAKASAFSNWPRELATGETKEAALQAFKAKYATLDINQVKRGAVTFDIYGRSGEHKGYWIGKKLGRNPIFLAGPFATVGEARTFRDGNGDQLVQKLAKSKEIPNERRDTNNPRVGEDMRNGQDVTPRMFAESFGFKGVEFGNWVDQKKRQKDLNDSFDALMDMAAILNIPPKALSLNGELGLAFGARGSGGIGAAAAHYEQDKVVINLTKKEGAGSLGHEWWHALDNYFQRLRGKVEYATEALDVSLASRGSEFVANTSIRKEMIEAFGKVVESIRTTAMKARSAKLDAKRSKAYWTTGREMAARAFESYLISKLQDQNASNDYLANIVDDETWAAAEKLGFELEGSYPYPTAGEIPVISAGFDHLFSTIKTRETEKGIALESRRAGDDVEDLYAAMQPKFGVSPDYQGEAGTVNGKLMIRSPSVVLDKPAPTVNIHGFHGGGDRFLTFSILDAQTNTKVGMVELEMDGNTPVALHDIYIDEDLHGSGYGAQTVGALLSLNPDANLKVVEIISQSERFWESVGAQKGYDGNADLNWHQFAEARPDARGRQEGRESVRPGQAEEGVRGDQKREDHGRGIHSAEEVADVKSDAAEKSPADAGLSVSGKLPDAIVANPLSETKGDDFAHAKAGSVAASIRLAKKLITAELVEQLRSVASGNPLVLGVSSIEATGKNALPRIGAVVLAERLGLKWSSNIVQSTSPKRTDMDGLGRIFNRPEFFGDVEPGRSYILLDDALTQGGTFAAMAQHIEAGGGHVVAVVALTGKQYSSKLAPTAETLKQVQEKFGDIEGEFRQATGYGFDGLTESEARYLARFDSPDAIRDRILAEARARSDGGSAGDLAEGAKSSLTNKTPPQGGVSVSVDGSVASAIDRVVEKFKTQFKGTADLNIRVVESIYEIPSRYRPSRYAEGVFHDSAGLIYLVADNLLNRDGTPNTRRAFQVLMHESVGHYGLAHMMGKRFSGLLAHVMKVARDSSVKRDIYGPGDKQYATVEAVRLRYPDASDEQVAQEVLARMAESDAASSRFGYARAIVRQWLRDIARAFGIKLEVSTAELNDLIAKASGYMRAGENVENEIEPSGMLAASERSSGLESRARVAGDSGRQYSADQQQTFRNIGREVVTPTVKERVAGMWQNIGKKLQQGIADQFAPLKDLGGDAYMLSRMSKGADGALEAMLMYGRVFLNGGIYDVDVKDGGVIDKLLRPLGKEADDFMWWIAGNRADQLASQGREHLMTPADIANLKALASGKLDFDYTLQSGKTTRDRATAYADAKQIMAGFNKSVLDIAEQSGLIDGAERTIWENDFYVPFYREAEEGEKKFPSVKKGLVRQKAFERLKGGTDKLNHDLLANTIMNWSHMLNAAAKNRAAKASLEAAESAGVATKVQAGEKGAVYFRDAGKEIHYTVEDPFVLDAVTALEFSGFSGLAMQAMGTFKRWLTMGVTANPAFKIRNLIRDSVSALGQSELSYNLAKNISEGYKATERNSQTYASMLAGGGVIRFGTMIEGNRADHVRQLVEKGVDPSTIIDNESKLKAIWNRRVMPLVEAYNELGDRSENINRAALYEQLKKKGLSHAEASMAARDLLDFSMGGIYTPVRFLTQTVPFANARIQGLYKLGRAAKENPKRMGYVVGAVALASLALLAAYHDDDEWKKREDWDRDNYWWFRVGGVAYRIPKPFEIGAIGTLAERSAELLFDKEMDGHRFGDRLRKMVGDTFAMNPVPQMFKPLLDLYSNKDSFTGRPIETTGMEKMRTEDRFTARSSEVAKAIGKAGVLSPVQVDHIIRGYFGWLGTASVKATDEILRAGSDTPRPAMKLRDVFLVGNFVETLPTNSSRYVTQMYDQAKEIEEAYNSWRSYLKQGNTEKANEVFESEKDKINRYRMLQNVKAAESRINAQVRRIESDKGMSGEAKRAELDRLSKQKDEIARSVIGTAGLKK